MKFKSLQILFVVGVTMFPVFAWAQGCVAVKNMTTCHLNTDSTFEKGFQFSFNYRFFRSYKHFVGDHEETHRVNQGTQVINNDNSVNIGIAYSFSKRWSASMVIPYIFIDRSSMYEHLGNSSVESPNPNNPTFRRFVTHSEGIGDIRLLAYYNALQRHNTNLTFGLGFKLPTGDYNAKDQFHRPEGLVENVVDQSIQPGDGGLGTIVDVDLRQSVGGNFGVYLNAMYMFNPRNTNGVKRSANLVRTGGGDEIPLSNEFSVTDQYLLRLGASFNTHGLQAFLGGRMECIPSKDLIGKSDGFRRPGYIISVEPSLFYSFGVHSVGVNIPIAIERNRTRSQIDIARGTNPNTGKPFHGDAAFADWLLSLTYSYRLPM